MKPFIMLIFLFFSSCNSNKYSEQPDVAKNHESDCKNYDISYHLQGRIKSIEIFDEVPFKFELLTLKKNLIRNDIHLKIVNESEFELSYTINNQSIISRGTFNEKNENREMDYRIDWVNKLPPEDILRVKESDFFFVIHCKN